MRRVVRLLLLTALLGALGFATAAIAFGRLAVGTSDTEPDPTTTTTTTTALTPVALSITGTAPDLVKVGTAFTYSLAIHNGGDTDATAVTLSDAPQGATLDPATLPPECAVVVNVASCTFDLAAGATKTIALRATAPETRGTISNEPTVTPGPGQADGDVTDNSMKQITNVGDVDLTATISSSAESPVPVGGSFTYFATVANAGPGTSFVAKVSDRLPANVAFDSATIGGEPTECSTNSDGFTSCLVGTVGPAASVTVALHVHAVSQGVTVHNRATAVAGSEDIEYDPSNNGSNDTTVRIYNVDLSIVTSATPNPGVVGENVTLMIKVTNNGPQEAHGTTFSGSLPSSLTYVSNDKGCTFDDERFLQCTTGDLQPAPSVPGATDNQFTVNVVATPTVTGNFTIGDSLSTGGSDVDRTTSDNTAQVVLTVNRAPSTLGKVVILDSTVNGGVNSAEALAANAAGYDADVLDAEQWGALTTAQFRSYRAIILGDRSCSSDFTAAVNNVNTWSAAVDGNVIINGTDPVLHGKGTVTTNSVAFALASTGKTGLYVSLSCTFSGFPSTGAPVDVLSGLGSFSVKGWNADDVHKVAEHPALAGLTDAYLSHWGQSIHEAFTTWPSDFLVLAIALDGTKTYTANDGTSGTPYILARGTGLAAISDISLAPASATAAIGTTHTLTATIAVNGTPVAGKTVNFTATAGPNAGATGTGTTDSSGVATFGYGSSAQGTDTWKATFLDSAGRTQTSNTVTVNWTGSVSAPAPPKADVHVSVSPPLVARTGEDLTFTVTVANSGPDTATGVSLITPVPTGATLVSSSKAGGPCASPCPIGTLTSGASATVTLVYRTATTGPLTVSPSAESDYDPDHGNNAASATANVIAPGAAPPPPPPSSAPGTFNAISVGTVTVNGVPYPADQQFILNSGDVVDATNGIITFTDSDGKYGSWSSTPFTARRSLSSLGAASAPAADSNLSAKFEVQQPATPGGLTTLTLTGGDFSACNTPRSLSVKSQKPIQQLWGSAKGNFTTKGRFSAATVRGTVWSVQDRCDGTLTQVVEGVVDVLDSTLHKTVSVGPGQSYLALAPAERAAFRPPASTPSQTATQVNRRGLVWGTKTYKTRKSFTKYLTTKHQTWAQFAKAYPKLAAALTKRK